MLCPYCGGYGETSRVEPKSETIIVERSKQCHGGLYCPSRIDNSTQQERSEKRRKADAAALAVLDAIYAKKEPKNE